MSWNPYGTIGPAHLPDVTWHEYFEDYRAKLEQSDLDADVDTTPIILSQAIGADLSGFPAVVSRLYQNMLNSSPASSCGRAWAYVNGAPYKSGDSEGELRPDKVVKLWWLYGIYNGKILRVTYQQEDEWLKPGSPKCVNRQLGWDALSDRELKELIA